MLRTFFYCLLLWVVLASGSRADDGQTPVKRLITPLAAARIEMVAQNYAAAQRILEFVLARDPNSIEAIFLMAEVKAKQGKFADALPLYRQILARRPDLVRVRLDLAQAEFRTGDDEGADYNFRLALSQPNLPDTVVDNIGRYLSAIQSRKRLTYSLNVSIAPDSNINAATASNHVTVFGLPFTLSQQAVQKSGIGLVTTLGGGYFLPIDDGKRLRTGGVAYSALYPGHSQFDDIQVRGNVGPQWLWNDSDVSALAVVGKRWYGNSPYSESVGGRLEGSHNLTKQLQVSSYLEGLSDSYHTEKYQNGFNLDQGNFLTYYFNPRTLVRLIAGLGYESADSSIFENWYWRSGLGLQHEFPLGITAYVQPDVRATYYSGFDPMFSERRLDRMYTMKISAYKRDWSLFGFSPVVSVTYTMNRSNEAIYNFHRFQVQLGVTKQF